MSTTTEQKSVALGTKQDLVQGVQLRTKEVHVPRLEKRFRVRELTQGEVEEISAATVKQESDAQGNITARADSRGYKARTIACALVNEDLTPWFAQPMVEYEQLNRLTPDVVDVLFKACDELSSLTREEREKVGKGSGKTPSTAGSSA